MPSVRIIKTSMLNHDGISLIEDAVEAMVYDGEVAQNESVMVTSARHQDLLRRAAQSAEDGLFMTKSKEALEFIEIDVNSCYAYLGEIIGESVQDDIINEVFSRFCLGK